MTDLEILKRLYNELENGPPLTIHPKVLEVYKNLIDLAPEDGLELQLACRTFSDLDERALTALDRYQYVEKAMHYHGSEHCYFYHINLRGKKFMELANGQVKPVVVEMQDSGKREKFTSGAVRDTDEGKPRPDLISPFATEKLADWLRLGAEKYAPRNWERGLPLSRCLASALRHLMKYQQGVRDGEDNLTAAFCNLMFMLHTTEMIERGVLPESLNDLPQYNKHSPDSQDGESYNNDSK